MGRFDFAFASALALAGAASAPQDRAELPDKIDSWYRIENDEEQRGWTHETLKRIGGRHSWEYSARSQYFIDKDGTDRRRTLSVTAKLDDSFRAQELQAVHTYEDAKGSLTLTQEAGSTRIKAQPIGGDPSDTALKPETDVHATPAFLLFAMRQSGRLAKTDLLRARVLDLEKGMPVDVTFTPREPVRRDVAGQKGVFITPVVFGKAPVAASPEYEIKEVWVDMWGRTVEVATRGKLRIRLVASEKEATEGIPLFFPKEPFDKPSAMNAPRGSWTDLPIVDEDRLPSALSGAFKDLEILREHKSEGRTDEARKAYSLLLRTWKTLRTSAETHRDRAIAARVAAFRDDLETAWPGALETVAEARPFTVSAGGKLEEGDDLAAASDLATLRRFLGRLELEGRPERDTVNGWVQLLEPLLADARVRRELHAKKLELTGITLSEVETTEITDVGFTVLSQRLGTELPVRFVRSDSHCVINGKTLKTGQVLDREGVHVEHIGPNSVRVGWKGQTRELPLGGR